jgi:hypothetical protein
MHNCFKETAETFISCTGMKQPADYPVDIDKRKRECYQVVSKFLVIAMLSKFKIFPG